MILHYDNKIQVNNGKEMFEYDIKIPKYRIVNKWDRSLLPIMVKLPKPPPLHLIDNIDKRPEQQIFRKAEYPIKLKKLEEAVNKYYSDLRDSGKTFDYSEQRHLVKLWNELLSNTRLYREEIQWIKKQHYHIREGYWCVIDKEVCYIPGWYYFYVNFWTIDDVAEVEFRFRDMEEHIFMEYLYTTTENENYEDTGSRTFYGYVKPKHRRDGATHKGLNAGYCIAAFDKIQSGIFGIQSHSGDSAKEIYRTKFIPAFRKMPFFLRLLWKGSGIPEDGINFDCPTYAMPRESSGNAVIVASSVDRQFFDSMKLHASLFDEEGKSFNTDIFTGWTVVKPTMSVGNGAKIFGFSMHPSTVEEMDKRGGASFLKLLNQSRFYDRSQVTAQTTTGLARYFDTCVNGMEGYIDIFGKAVIKDPIKGEEWRLKNIKKDANGKMYGSLRAITSERKRLRESGSPTDIETLIQTTRKFPIEYLECFSSNGGGVGFDRLVLKDKIDQINKMKLEGEYPVSNWRVEWEIDGVRYTPEEFTDQDLHLIKGFSDNGIVHVIPDENGRFRCLEFPKENNRRIKKDGVWHPLNPDEYTHSIDPVTFFDKKDKNIQGIINKKNEVKQGTSDLGFCTFRERNFTLDPNGTDVSLMRTNRFVVSYRARPEHKVAMEECLMMNIFFGGLCNIETNVKDAYEYYINRGFDGYLLYMIDEMGNVKSTPGWRTGTETKQMLFKELKSHIKTYGKNEMLDNLVSEWDSISDIEDMNHYDLVAASGGCLIGSKSKHRDLAKNNATKKIDPVQNRGEFFSRYTF